MRLIGETAKDIAQVFKQISRQTEHLFYWNVFIRMCNVDFLEMELKLLEDKIVKIRKLIVGE